MLAQRAREQRLKLLVWHCEASAPSVHFKSYLNIFIFDMRFRVYFGAKKKPVILFNTQDALLARSPRAAEVLGCVGASANGGQTWPVAELPKLPRATIRSQTPPARAAATADEAVWAAPLPPHRVCEPCGGAADGGWLLIPPRRLLRTPRRRRGRSTCTARTLLLDCIGSLGRLLCALQPVPPAGLGTLLRERYLPQGLQGPLARQAHLETPVL